MTGYGKSWRSLVRLVTFALLVLLSATACQLQLAGPAARSTFGGDREPNYDFPLDQFQQADFNVLASEFRDQYSGQYVVFDAHFVMTSEGVTARQAGAAATAPKMRFVDVREATLSNGSKHASVIWSVSDRELGLPIVSLKMSSPVRVYGYVLPAGSEWRYKSRTDRYGKAFGEIMVILLKMEARQ